MEAKKKRGRPPGPRKNGQSVRMVLASDCIAIADGLVPRYGSRTAAIEALIRKGGRELRESLDGSL